MCQCSSCKATDALTQHGFAAWPKGDPAGPAKSRAAYSAHVAFSKSGGIQRAIPAINPDPAAFYACPATSRGEILRVLRQTFEVSA